MTLQRCFREDEPSSAVGVSLDQEGAVTDLMKCYVIFKE